MVAQHKQGRTNQVKLARSDVCTQNRTFSKCQKGQCQIQSRAKPESDVRGPRILVLSSTTKAATSEACIPRYIRPMSTEGACKPPPFSAAHFRHPLLFELPCFLDKVLDRVLRDVDVFCFEPRSNLLWLRKASPQEFLRLTFYLSRALSFNVDRT